MELVFSPIFTKFPGLKVALSEGGTGWIAYCLERMDYVHAHHSRWTLHEFPGGKKPSEVFREHVITCFIDDAVGLATRDLIGIDTMTWECDYPHSDSTWPRSPEKLWASLGGVSDEEIDKITHLNTMRQFQYDPFAHIPRDQCTVAALRAQATHVDLTPRVGGGGKKPSDYEHGYATVGDIITQMSSAFATPFADDVTE